MTGEPAVPSLGVPVVPGHPCIDALETAIKTRVCGICVDKGLFCSTHGHFFFSFLMVLSPRSKHGHKEGGMLLCRGKGDMTFNSS